MKLFKCALSIVLLLPLFAPSSYATSSNSRYEITFPTFPIMVNGTPVDNIHSQNPLFLYENVTYFPMTWNNTAALGLELNWDQKQGLNITKLPSCQPLAQNLQTDPIQLTSNQVVPPPFPVIVNGKTINNTDETYPILFLNDIVYFPMTWKFTNTEFKWDTLWSSLDGYSIASCEEQKNENMRKQEELASKRNLDIGGVLAVDGDWVYMSPNSNKPSLEKWSKDGNVKIKLADDNGSSINAIGDWLYYSVRAPGSEIQFGGIYKMRQDGTERTKLSPISASRLVVDRDWIYFLETNEAGISRMKTDGSVTEQIVSEKGIEWFYISNNELFFTQNSDEFQSDLTGKGKKQLDKNMFNNGLIVDGWNYHTKMVDGMNGIYKTSMDGSTSIKLYEVSVWARNGIIYSLQYRDGWIYFLQGKNSLSSHFDVNKIRIDGTGFTRYANVGFANELYNVNPFFYVDYFTPIGGDGAKHYNLVKEEVAP